jgi:hypothetical protein
MATNLLEMLMRAITPATTKSVSDHLGESQAGVQSGLALLLPSLLGGLASKASTPAGASSVFSALTEPRVDTDLLGTLSSLLVSGRGSAIANVGSIGNALLASVFGADKAVGLGTALAGITGMKPGNAGSLATLVVPALFGWLKKLIGERGLNATRTAELLIGQRDHLAGQLDPALTKALGLAAPSALLAGLAPAGGAAPAGSAASGGGLRWFPWLVAALLAIGALWSWLGAGGRATGATASPPAVGFDLKVPAKVYFETGRSAIGAEGVAVVQAVAGLLAREKTTRVDVTGYTDKTGDAAANQDLAKSRALGVQAALVAAGVGTDRIATRPPIFVEIGAGGADAEARRVEITAR